MIEAAFEVLANQRDGRHSHSAVGVCQVDHRPIVDPREVAILLRKSQGIGVGDPPAEVLAVFAVGRRSELHDLLVAEEVRDRAPGAGSDVMGLIHE